MCFEQANQAVQQLALLISLLYIIKVVPFSKYVGQTGVKFQTVT